MRSFRERFDTLYPVSVRRVSLPGHWGDTSLARRRGEPILLVRIERDLPPEAEPFVLTHELAHCVQWRLVETNREDDHDAEWGVAYARIWRTMFGA